MELQEMKEQIVEWMEMMKYGYRDLNLYMCEMDFSGRGGIRVDLFTENNIYHITAFPPHESSGKSYLGCTSSSRKPRAGEDWTRGNDLADGEFSFETWFRIVSDIVGYELVKIHRPIKDLYVL